MKTRLTIATFGVLMPIALVLALWRYTSLPGALLRLGHKHDLRAITSQIDRIPNVKLTRAGGDKDISLEHIWAEIQVPDKGTLIFHDLRSESFCETHHLCLHQVGDIVIHRQSFGHVGVVNTETKEPVKSWSVAENVDIGPQGIIADLRPLAITNVQSAILRYDDIYRLFNSWSRSSEKKTWEDEYGVMHVVTITLAACRT